MYIKEAYLPTRVLRFLLFLSGLRCLKAIKVSIVSSSSSSAKISYSKNVTRQSSKRLSPNLFLNLDLTKVNAENTLSTLAVATGSKQH